MRSWSLPLSLPLAASFAAFSAATCLAQAPASSPAGQSAPASQSGVTAPANASPSTPPAATVRVPGSSAPAVAAPQGQAPGTLPAMPAYGDQQAPQQSVPPPVHAQKPVVAPAQTTAEAPVAALPPYVPYGLPDEDRPKLHYGSTFIPVDSWVYPAMARLYGMGFADTMFLGLRPWTRQSVLHILDETESDVMTSGNDEARSTFAALKREVSAEETGGADDRGLIYGTKEVYDRAMGIGGPTLHDSYHIGETIANDYGRPFQNGFNNLLGFHEMAEYGRFSLDVRGEYQHAPAGAGYNQALASALSQGANPAGNSYTQGDLIPYSGFNAHQADIPQGPIAAANPFRLIEASLSYHLLGHEISGGKTDAWLGPGFGGAMAWSNNADNIYSFRIDRVEPLHIPLLSRLLGPFRYDFFYGSLKGHTAPNSPYAHSEQVSFKPTKNLEFAFQRTIVFGGKGHEPVTLHTFLKGFFDPSDTTTQEKYSRDDPGARFADFAASWRLPYLEKFATLYVDSEAHDDVNPISAPRRADYRTGLYLSQIPGARRFDLRVEGVNTDPGVSRSQGGTFAYFEVVQQQAYTNEGQLMGDVTGREGKSGNAWLTYHLSGNQWVQLQYMHKKDSRDFIPGVYNAATNTYGPGGTTQNQFRIELMKRFNHDQVELHAWYMHDQWKAPIYLTGTQNTNVTAVQLTFFPALQRRFSTRPSAILP